MIQKLKLLLARWYGPSKMTVWPDLMPGYDPVRVRFDEECG